MGRILGVDFGLARIGIAITDERKIMALPVGAFRTEKTPALTVQMLMKELASYGAIEKIVIGLPLLLNGKEGDMALAVKAFGSLLNQAFQVEVVYWDERLTSAQVDKLMMDSGFNRKKRAQHSDAMAAHTILENYLDSLRI
ncbi:MAG: Holliday junction resolvase RuvX [Rhabdochlamydiaceae bacterium]|nr:Holliday junction resolvase RuvX [Rhabdochlamydiaceae bacterium]